MKVLVVASSVYTKSLPNGSITGLAVMVRDIYDEVSKHCDVVLWASQAVLPQETVSDTFLILSSGVKSWSKGIRIRDVFKAFGHTQFSVRGMKADLRKIAHKRLQHKEFRRIVNEVKPDIVSFHDFDDLNTELMQYCHQQGIKAVITNHLYIGHAEGCSNYDYSRRNEKILLSQPELKVSVISTGMKRRMMQDYPTLKSENVYITLDGTSFMASDLPHKKEEGQRKILLCVANVMERKNQIQLVRSLSLFDKEYRNRFVVYFLGSDPKGMLVKAIEQYRCADVAVYKGKVRPKEMTDYYSNAFATITTTLCEGFGLTMIEGYAYGLPAILPNDIDSFDDIYDEKCAVAINGRKDEDIVAAIKQCLDTEWDTEFIKARSQQFTMDKVAAEYVDVYKDIIKK